MHRHRPDEGRLVVRRLNGQWPPAIAMYATHAPRAIAWIQRARRWPKRNYYWIERIGTPAFVWRQPS